MNESKWVSKILKRGNDAASKIGEAMHRHHRIKWETDNLNALDNGHLYAFGQREHCTVSEWILSERLCDALDIIQILAWECRALSSNKNAYDDENHHSVNMDAVEAFLISGKLDPNNIKTTAASGWRRGVAAKDFKQAERKGKS